MVISLQEVVHAGTKGEGMEGSLRRWLGRSLLAAVVAVGSAALAGGPSASAAAASPGQAESGFVQRINGARSAQGRAPLQARGDLAAVARNHAQRMADRSTLFHNPNLAGEVPGWDVVSENVGMGSSVDQVHSAFMASSTHRGNILSAEVDEVGVGVVTTADGSLWVVEIFRRPAGAPAPVPNEPAPAAAPASAAAAVPAAPRPIPPPTAPSPTTTAPASPTTTVAPTTATTTPIDPIEQRRLAAAAHARWALLDAERARPGADVARRPADPWAMALWLTVLGIAGAGLGALGVRRLAET